MDIVPCALPCPKTQEHQSNWVDSWVHRVYENGHRAIGTRLFTIWFSACPILWSNPILKRYFMDIVPCVLPCPKTQEHQSNCVDSWVHTEPESGHQPLGRDKSLWRSACSILWSNPILYRYFMDIFPCAFPCPKTQKHQSTLVDSWDNRVPKMDFSHWDVAIHYGVRLFQYRDQARSWNVILRISPPVYSLAPRLHKVPENEHRPFWRGNSLWRSACPILWSNPIQQR